jgi:uncharacterized flavoprotein (TIGR03862 family)
VANDQADVLLPADATILAMGGASWPLSGSDAGWVGLLQGEGVAVSPLRPSNCGFAVSWSDVFAAKCAWRPLKNVRLSHGHESIRGELMISDYGIEGGAVYALSAGLRDAIERDGSAELMVDLHPDIADETFRTRLDNARRGDSATTRLRRAGLAPMAISLLGELGLQRGHSKVVRLTLTAPQPIERAISSAGGVAWGALDGNFMLRPMPGVFAAGEMLDWEAPTGGYLLQACFSTGVAAARGALRWLEAGMPAAER